MCAPAPAPPVEEEKPPVEEEVPPEEVISPFVTVYSATTPPIVEGVANLAEEKTGVEIRWHFLSCGEINAKLKAEAPRFTADVLWFLCVPESFLVRENDWAVAYEYQAWKEVPTEWGLINPDIYLDPTHKQYCTCVYGFCLVANEEKIAEAGYTMPNSWDDLLDPKWKDEIIMPSPLTSGTSYMMLYTWMTEYGFNRGKGEEGGWEFLEALDKNIHHYTRSGGAPTELIGRGEFMLGVTTDQNVLIVQEKGYPLTVIVPEEGIGYEPLYTAILEGTERLPAAQKVVDFFSTPEFCGYLADLGYVTRLPARPSALYGGIPNYVPNVDHTWAAENKERLCNEWKERIGRVAE